MLAQRDLGLYTPPHRSLATLRRVVEAELTHCPCQATQQRVLLAVNEVIANVLRHASPPATDIHIEFIDHDEQVYCVVRDDGGAFGAFKQLWQQATGRYAFSGAHVGLRLVKNLWPEAFYIPRSEAFGYNSFILPLTEKGMSALPHYFRPCPKTNWSRVLAPLVHKERA